VSAEDSSIRNGRRVAGDSCATVACAWLASAQAWSAQGEFERAYRAAREAAHWLALASEERVGRDEAKDGTSAQDASTLTFRDAFGFDYAAHD